MQLNEREDGKPTSYSGSLFHKQQADTGNDVWNEVVLAKWTQTEYGWWIQEWRWVGGEKYDGGMMHRAFCLEQLEQRGWASSVLWLVLLGMETLETRKFIRRFASLIAWMSTAHPQMYRKADFCPYRDPSDPRLCVSMQSIVYMFSRNSNSSIPA